MKINVNGEVKEGQRKSDSYIRYFPIILTTIALVGTLYVLFYRVGILEPKVADAICQMSEQKERIIKLESYYEATTKSFITVNNSFDKLEVRLQRLEDKIDKIRSKI